MNQIQYIHSPYQHPIEFICFIGSVISLWTDFSVISMYAYGKRFFRRNQKQKQKMKKITKLLIIILIRKEHLLRKSLMKNYHD